MRLHLDTNTKSLNPWGNEEKVTDEVGDANVCEAIAVNAIDYPFTP